MYIYLRIIIIYYIFIIIFIYLFIIMNFLKNILKNSAFSKKLFIVKWMLNKCQKIEFYS